MGRHYTFARELCEGPTWDVNATGVAELLARERAEREMQRWLLPAFEDMKVCVLEFHQAWHNRTAEEIRKVQEEHCVAERFRIQSRMFLDAAPIERFGLDGSIVCAACIGDQRYGVPLCVRKEFYNLTASPEGTGQLWWLGMEEYANLYHGDKVLEPLNRHFVGAHVASAVRALGLGFDELVRMLTGPRYYERNLLHGAMWKWVGCSPNLADIWKEVAIAVPLVRHPVANLTRETPPFVNDGVKKVGNLYFIRAQMQRLHIVHGLGHGFLHHHVWRAGPSSSPIPALTAALTACQGAPEDLRDFHRRYGIDRSEGKYLHDPCVCGAFHSFFMDLDPTLEDLGDKRFDVASWPDICQVLLPDQRFVNQCILCGAHNTKDTLGLIWCREHRKFPNGTLNMGPCDRGK